jgi:hypothetical protein
LVISQVLQFLAFGAAKLLFFSGSCSETEVSEQLYYMGLPFFFTQKKGALKNPGLRLF